MSAPFEALLRGLMTAEGLTTKALYDRSHLLPFWTRRKRREIAAAHDKDGLLEQSLPFALNQPTTPFENAPGAHSEWVAFQLQVILAGGGYRRSEALRAWRELGRQRSSLRLTVAQHAALENLARGKEPPVSGHDNPHYFDDSACFRAIPLLFVVGEDLLDEVAADAAISNALDGVWAAQALAAALRGALETADGAVAVRRALQAIPAGSWLQREVEGALQHAGSASSLFELIDLLASRVTNHAYNYGNSAPETLATTLAILSHTGGEPQSSLLAALALPKTAGSVAPMVGALLGALGRPLGDTHDSPRLRGVALPHLAGSEPLELLARVESLGPATAAGATAAPRKDHTNGKDTR